MLDFGFSLNSPVAVRYPRGKGSGKAINKKHSLALEIGKAYVVYDSLIDNKSEPRNKTISILSFGSLLNEALQAAQQLANTYHIISHHAQHSDVLITLEDNAICGGAGSAVNELLSQQTDITLINLGLPDNFPAHGTQADLHHEYGLDCSGLIKTIQNLI
jgi:1-deoxy-D-xylulose-5-phosphate synthase